jgi:hypothetical protein
MSMKIGKNLTQDQNGVIFQWAGLDLLSALRVSEQERERGGKKADLLV